MPLAGQRKTPAMGGSMVTSGILPGQLQPRSSRKTRKNSSILRTFQNGLPVGRKAVKVMKGAVDGVNKFTPAIFFFPRAHFLGKVWLSTQPSPPPQELSLLSYKYSHGGRRADIMELWFVNALNIRGYTGRSCHSFLKALIHKPPARHLPPSLCSSIETDPLCPFL